MPWRYKNRNAVKDGFRRKLREDMTASAEAGAEAMRQVIRTVDTTDSGPGRIDTGAMLASVTSSGPPAQFEGKKTYNAFFGWPTETLNMGKYSQRMTRANGMKAYFLLQEHGFRHSAVGMIEGMRSMQAGADAYRREFDSRGW